MAPGEVTVWLEGHAGCKVSHARCRTAGVDSPKALHMDLSNLGNENFTFHICTELNRNNKLMQHVLAYTCCQTMEQTTFQMVGHREGLTGTGWSASLWDLVSPHKQRHNYWTPTMTDNWWLLICVCTVSLLLSCHYDYTMCTLIVTAWLIVWLLHAIILFPLS